ncbi:hypothetical protein CDAR_260681 [Caerostris darwini]|uniref:Helix-turn-helix type 11 domain-containing protein n=1 Tax=Caerostris darwini TaxID=1538125 RepID=A0AAV4NQV6_9ARAC|nr:hypothetical protein CDAR_260681 [Caerostris darwini]
MLLLKDGLIKQKKLFTIEVMAEIFGISVVSVYRDLDRYAEENSATDDSSLGRGSLHKLADDLIYSIFFSTLYEIHLICQNA